MKKIGILTLPLHSNYGGLLQAFALQRTLENLGHKALLIDGKDVHSSRLRKMLSLSKQYLLKIIKGSSVVQPDWTTLKEKEIIGQHTSRFVREHIKTTDKLPSVINYRVIEKYQFDAYVVGSDQVWRPQYTPSITNYFYDFLSSIDNVKRIAYAASFGVDQWLFTVDQTIKCKALAKKFDAVGVREDSGIELCKEKLGIDSVKTLDPTLLLSKEVYEDLVREDLSSKPKGNMFSYVLDTSEENTEIIQKVSKILGLTPFVIMPEKDMSALSKNNIDKYIFPSVTEWINGFVNAEFVITDSFHGTLFSIIFNRPFISIGNKKRGLSRFTSILSMLGLENRLVLSVEDISEKLLMNPIDYERVNKVLEVKRKKSIEFLVSALK